MLIGDEASTAFVGVRACADKLHIHVLRRLLSMPGDTLASGVSKTAYADLIGVMLDMYCSGCCSLTGDANGHGWRNKEDAFRLAKSICEDKLHTTYMFPFCLETVEDRMKLDEQHVLSVYIQNGLTGELDNLLGTDQELLPLLVTLFLIARSLASILIKRIKCAACL